MVGFEFASVAEGSPVPWSGTVATFSWGIAAVGTLYGGLTGLATLVRAGRRGMYPRYPTPTDEASAAPGYLSLSSGGYGPSWFWWNLPLTVQFGVRVVASGVLALAGTLEASLGFPLLGSSQLLAGFLLLAFGVTAATAAGVVLFLELSQRSEHRASETLGQLT